jgi:hypothetical protein
MIIAKEWNYPINLRWLQLAVLPPSLLLSLTQDEMAYLLTPEIDPWVYGNSRARALDEKGRYF